MGWKSVPTSAPAVIGKRLTCPLIDGRSVFRRAAVQPKSKLVLLFDAGYAGHRDIERRRKGTHEWLRRRERQMNRRIKSLKMTEPSGSRPCLPKTSSA